MIYIQRKEGTQLETVDAFTTRKEAKAMLKEYQQSDYSAHYYISTRACRGGNSMVQQALKAFKYDTNTKTMERDGWLVLTTTGLEHVKTLWACKECGSFSTKDEQYTCDCGVTYNWVGGK